LGLNLDRLRKLASELRSSLKSLYELKSLPEEEFLKDIHKISSAKYNLIVAIEAAINMSNHLIAKRGFRTPEDFADTFLVLKEEGIFNDEFALKFQRMARFRNRLVHLYWNVDNKEIYKVLQNNLPDLEKFLKEFGKEVKEQM